MGTWALPDTKEKANQLKEILEKPLPANEAADRLYHTLGDDNLYDFFNELEGSQDVRITVRNHLKEFIETQLHTCFKPWEAEAIEICKKIFSK